MESATTPARRAPGLLWFAAVWSGLVGVPLLWIGHILLCAFLVGTACVGGPGQRNALPWGVVRWLLVGASALAVLLAIAGVVATRRAWRRAAALRAPKRDTMRFVALCGMTVSTAFALAFAFTLSVLLMLPLQRLCETFR